MFEFKLPDLGEGIHEGEVLQWHVAVGETVEEDAPLVEIETDKAAVTIPSPRGGKIHAQNGAVGDTVIVGSILVVIDDGSGAAAAPPPAPAEAEAPAAAETAAPAAPATPTTPGPAVPVTGRPVPAAPATRRLARELGVDINLVTPTGPAGRVMPDDVRAFASAGVPETAAPAVRRLARELGVDLESVKGTGPAGTVMPEDVHQAAGVEAPEAAEAAAPTASAETEFAAHAATAIPFLDIDPMPDFTQWGPIETVPLRSIRRKVAHRMVTSQVLVPHVAHMDEADVTLLEDFRMKERKRREGQPGGRLTLLSFVVKAVTAGLKAAPIFNTSLDPFRQEIVFKNYYHMGIAVDSGHGLLVPVIRDTDRKSIMDISAAIQDVATRARAGRIEVSELRGGTFTITNVGPLAGTALIPTINYPEVAILGMGRVQEKPVVRDGEIVIRKILPLTLSFDHRVADGADAARFVAELARQLSDPNLLLLEA